MVEHSDILFELSGKRFNVTLSWQDKAIIFGWAHKTQFRNWIFVNLFVLKLRFLKHYRGLLETES